MSATHKWENYTHEERKASFNNYAKYNIIQAIKIQSAPWLTSKSVQEIQKIDLSMLKQADPMKGLMPFC